MQIAERFNSRYKKSPPLAKIIHIASSGSEKAQRFIERNRLLFRGARELNVAGEELNFFPYLYAVANAQIYLRREGREILLLKKQIVKNYPKDKCLEVTNAFLEVARTLESDENNFFNFLIDVLKNIHLAKKAAVEEGTEQKDTVLLTIGDFEEELINGDSGFALAEDGSEYKKVIELILLAVKTPLQENN